jgi:hypothetical protein
MKKLYFVITALILSAIIYSCTKTGTLPSGNGCTTQIKKANYNIKSADSVAAVHLFQQNKMNYSNLSFERIILNDTIGSHVYQHIFAYQSFNGLQIMSGEAAYQFLDGVYQSSLGKIYSSVNLDNHSHLSLSQLRTLFMSESIDKQGLNPSYRDSCITAQFGYYDVNAGTGNETTNMVKAWRVQLKNNGFPLAIFNDDNSKLIVYDSGIRTFN